MTKQASKPVQYEPLTIIRDLSDVPHVVGELAAQPGEVGKLFTGLLAKQVTYCPGCRQDKFPAPFASLVEGRKPFMLCGRCIKATKRGHKGVTDIAKRLDAFFAGSHPQG